MTKLWLALVYEYGWVVIVDGVEVGTIEKRASNRSTLNGWKAYAGIGFGTKYAGTFYDRIEATKWGLTAAQLEGPDMKLGGKEAAIAAVAQSHVL